MGIYKAIAVIACSAFAAGCAGGDATLEDELSELEEQGYTELGVDEQAIGPITSCQCKRRVFVDWTCVDREGPNVGQVTSAAAAQAHGFEATDANQNVLMPTVGLPIEQCSGVYQNQSPYPTQSLLIPYTTVHGHKLNCWYQGLHKAQCGFNPPPKNLLSPINPPY